MKPMCSRIFILLGIAIEIKTTFVKGNEVITIKCETIPK